jgi:site-specific DNA-methyltransferase (adenine-specific)
MDRQRFLCGDSIEYMRALPDNAFDLAVADPQRGDGTAKEFTRRGGETFGGLKIPRGQFEPGDWDLQPMPKEFFDQLLRVSKNQIIFCAPFYTQYLEPGTSWLVWDKRTSGQFGDVELAWTSFKGAHRKIVFKWNGHQQAHSIKNGHRQGGNKAKNDPRIHPTQKPVLLYEWIFNEYAEPGAKIIDPTMGSGSSRIAAYKRGFDYMGIEQNPRHIAAHLDWWRRVYIPGKLELF